MTARSCTHCNADIQPRQRLCENCRPLKLRCKKCRKVKTASAFPYDESRPDHPWCKTCREGATDKHFQDVNAPLNGNICPMDDVPVRGRADRKYCSSTCRNRAASLAANYNLTPAQYRKMIEATGGICPLCRKRPTEWHVDHSHKTNLIFGVVCQACNVGALADTYHDPEMAERLVDYLKNPPSVQLGIESYAPPAKPSARKPQFGKWARKSAA